MTCDEALALAEPDSTGCPWARAESEGRVWLAIRYTAGLVLVEIDAGTQEQRSRRVVTETPPGLVWRPLPR